MRDMKEQQMQSATKAEERKVISLIKFPFKVAFSLSFFAFLGLLLSIAIYLIIWGFKSYDYAYGLLLHTYNYQASAFYIDKNTLIGKGILNILILFKHMLISVNEAINNANLGLNNVDAITNNINHVFGSNVNQVMLNLKNNSATFIAKFMGIVITSILIMLIKILTSLSFFVFYLFIVVIAIFDGNTRRIERRIYVCRESTFKHAIIKRLIIWIPLTVMILYLILPINISPAMVLIITSLSIFLMIRLLVSSYKKNL